MKETYTAAIIVIVVTILLVLGLLLLPSSVFAHTSKTERRQAAQELRRMERKFPITRRPKIRIVWTYKTHGYQAICFYKSGIIKINPHRRSPVKRIVRHEVGHIIDWRKDGRIDWGERIPSKYMR